MVLDSANKKVQEICDILREETLSPARREAKRILEEAKWEADEIIAKAKKEATKVHEDNEKKIAEQHKIFQSALHLAGKQALSKLKQSVAQMFSKQWESSLKEEMKKSNVVAKLVEVLVSAIEKEGLSADFLAVVPHDVGANMIVNHISAEVFSKLKEGKITIGDFKGGAQVKLEDQKMVIDMSDEAMIELLKSYVTEEIRNRIFANDDKSDVFVNKK